MAKTAIKAGDMVLVEWVDAMGHSAWANGQGFALNLGECETIGRLVSRDRTATVVASNRCLTNGTIDHAMAIPTSCVTRLSKLSRAR